MLCAVVAQHCIFKFGFLTDHDRVSTRFKISTIIFNITVPILLLAEICLTLRQTDPFVKILWVKL